MPPPVEPSKEQQGTAMLDARARMRSARPRPEPPAGTVDDHTELSFRTSFGPTHLAASTARQQVRSLIDFFGIEGPMASDLELVVAELASNAVEQAPGADIRLHLQIDEAKAVITVSNEAIGNSQPDGIVPSAPQEAGGLADRGWGLSIVESLSDELHVDQAGGWTTVCAIRHR